MSEEFRLTICQGKYEYHYRDGQQQVFRNGEPWAAMNDNLVGNKFVYSLAVELDEVNKKVERLKAELDDATSLIGFLNDHCNAAWDLVDADPEQLERIKRLVAPQQAAVPAGYKLVPVVVTPEITAVYGNDSGAYQSAQELHTAMLAAAPQPSHPNCQEDCAELGIDPDELMPLPAAPGTTK